MRNYQEYQKLKLVLSIFEKKWTGLIIRVLMGEEKKFSKIKKDIFEISDRVLSQRLMELEKMGILKRNVFTTIPIRVEYKLTFRGEAMKKMFYEMIIWSNI